jgi:hypothetical protein
MNALPGRELTHEGPLEQQVIDSDISFSVNVRFARRPYGPGRTLTLTPVIRDHSAATKGIAVQV